MRIFKKVFSLFFVAALLMLTACTDNNGEINGITFPYSPSQDIVIKEAFLYSGEFPEDGSFEKKENVLALKVENQSENDVQLLRVYVTVGERELFFEITTLPAGKKATVFEKNAQTISENETIKGIRSENRVDFPQPISLKEDVFQLSAPGKIFNLKNIGQTNISSDVFVYYKKVDENGDFFGGITFRSRAKGLKAGEIVQIPANHFDKADSKVVFVSYAEQ